MAQLRLRLMAVCVAITLLVFTQSSGDEAADTKLDLVVTPWHFLVQSVSAWDPTAAAGTLQNQAYGYLFPMGPYFLLGHLMQLPPWVTQRSWESLLVVAAFLGTFRLSRLLGVADWWPRVAAGLAYAMAPRMLMELGSISSELMPVAAAPWVLIPLVRGAQDGSPRRAAAWSGVALLFAGGTNAAATIAILPIPALWLLTRQRGPRRAALMRWWAVSVALASLWWAIPLVVLGKYSPPFLNWIESAAVTTSQTSLATSLRGAEHWQAYLGRGVWPAGYIFVSVRTVVLATAVVAVAGLVGLTLRRVPQRLFLGACLAAGLIFITFGHASSVGPLAAMAERTSLNGPLNAFRNIHKFDPLVRLPIAIGVGNLVAAGISRWTSRSRDSAHRRRFTFDPWGPAAVIAAYVAVAAVAPAITGDLVAQARTTNDPAWWSQAATWLGQQGPGRTLVVPGAAQPDYVWGSPRDDALQPFATAPWTVRDSIPLAQAGYIRLLDEIESHLAAGHDDPALASVLARSGIRYVLVRNDLNTIASQATPLQFIYATIENSTGFRQVHTFGASQIQAADPNRLIDHGATKPRAAITVFEDTQWTGDLSLLPASQAVDANGSAENLPELASAGVTPRQPVIFAPTRLPGASSSPPPLSVETDGVRRREFAFGSISQYSATMTATQPFRLSRAAHDYLPSPAPALSTVAYRGIRDVTASSSGADANAILNISPANGPWAAIDGNPATAWRVGAFRGAVGQWLQLDLLHSVSPSVATAAFVGSANGYPDRIEVQTAAGHLEETVAAGSESQQISLPKGATTFVRITIVGVDHGIGAAAGISELSLPGVTATRTLVVPGTGDPDVMTFAVADGHRNECLTVSNTPACDPNWAHRGEEDGSLDRTVSLSAATTYDVGAQVTLRPGATLDGLLDQGQPLTATASSVDTSDPRERPGAAVDGDPTTGWMASPTDLKPTLVVHTRHAHRITAVQISPLRVAAARAPVDVVISAGGETVHEKVPASGIITLSYAIRARSVSIHVLRAAVRATMSSSTGQSEFLPVGIATVTLLGPHEVQAQALTTPIDLSCSDGVTVSLNSQSVPLQVSASRQDVLAGTPVSATLCDDGSITASTPGAAPVLSLVRGTNRIVTSASRLTEPQSIILTRVGQPTRPAPVALDAHKVTWGATSRSVAVDTHVPALLIVHENVNEGWQATVNGRVLRATTVDGWQQAWLVPGGTSGVIHLRFTPQRAFSAGLIAGGGAAALLALLTAPPIPFRWRRRRRARVRRPRPALSAAAPGALIRRVAVIGVLTLLGSVTGLAVGCVLVVVDVAAAHRVLRPRGTWLAVGLTVGGASIAETIGTVTSANSLASSAGVQFLCLVATGLVVLVCFRPSSRPPRAGEPAE